MIIDDELRACADVALRNAYYHELQALVAKYRAAAAGLGSDMETGQAQVEIHTWGEDGHGKLVEHDLLQITTESPGGVLQWPHDSMLEALQDESADRLCLNGKIVLIKVDDEWCVAPDEES
jgi:hypothetical protein